MLLAGAGLLLLATYAPAPLTACDHLPLPHLLDAARAPWFFLWVQQMLKLGSPFFWGVFVPLAVFLLVSLIPYIFPKPVRTELGRWFPKRGRLAQGLAVFVLLAIFVLTILALYPPPEIR